MGNGKILILGGYGNTGRPLAELLLAETNVNLVLAGRNKSNADVLATELNDQFGGKRVCGAYADAADLATKLETQYTDAPIEDIATEARRLLQNAKDQL